MKRCHLCLRLTSLILCLVFRVRNVLTHDYETNCCCLFKHYPAEKLKWKIIQTSDRDRNHLRNFLWRNVVAKNYSFRRPFDRAQKGPFHLVPFFIRGHKRNFLKNSLLVTQKNIYSKSSFFGQIRPEKDIFMVLSVKIKGQKVEFSLMKYN